MHERRGVIASVCRDSNCVFMGALATVFDGVTNPEVLETLVPLVVVDDTMNIYRLWVASDCMNVIKEINGGGLRGQQCMIIKQILMKKQQFLEATFSYERREANGVAHHLAGSATT